MSMDKHTPELNSIPETMLWTLHNRATDAFFPRPILDDEAALKIYESIDYDFERSFGKPDGSHAKRSLVFDEALKEFLAEHPNGVIVNLGEGLETQRYRLAEEGRHALWFSIDVPDAIEIRERFIEPDERHRHLTLSALDESWMDEIPEGRPVFITAQGLFMYFEPDAVEQLFKAMAKRFPGAWLMFDHIPEWLSKKSLKGWKKTRHYTTPPMPWGTNKDKLPPLLRSWVPELKSIQAITFPMPRGIWKILSPIFLATPRLKHLAPGVTKVQF